MGIAEGSIEAPRQRGWYRVSRKAGSIVINRLRDRIRLGQYFGRWRPGDRLPSVRQVATLEQVDRKTAAAAYRRLELEGVVRVEPRSGVYLEGDRELKSDPLRRLHVTWLERTLTSASELGLDPEMVNRMFQGVAAVERRRIPVVDPDVRHGAVLARELSERTGLDCVATRPDRLPAEAGPLRDPPFILATPRAGEALKSLRDRVPIVLITLAAELFEGVTRAAGEDRVRVFVGTGALKVELERALERGLCVNPERVEVVETENDGPVLAAGDAGGARVVFWPGTSTRGERGTDGGDAGRVRHLVAESTLAAIQSQVARAALDHISTSSASSTR